MGQVLHGSATTTARSVDAGEALWRQSEDDRQVESADLGRRPADGTKGAPNPRS